MLSGDGFINFGDIADKERTDAFSLSGWVYREATAAGSYSLITKYPGASSKGYFVQLVSSVPEFFMRGTGGILHVSAATSLSLRQWEHWVMTYSGNSLASGVKFYINAELVSNNTPTSDTLAGTVLGGGADLMVGIKADASDYMVGRQTKTIIHDAELTQDEVTALYRDDNSLHTEYSWLWREGSGSTLAPWVGGVTGAITNPVWSTNVPR